tara:strand:+ start:424 stop:924 length:501 start_codon:yes stop_codon:yes gene_type:complete
MKNLILILAMVVSSVSFTQIAKDAFENDKPLEQQDIDILYDVTHVSYSIKDMGTDLYGEFESGVVEDMVSHQVVFNKNIASFLFPTVNSGLIPVMVGELVDEEVQISGMTLMKFAAKYKFNDKIFECDLYVRDRDTTRSTLYFATEQIVIVYEVERVGSRPHQRTY